MSDVYREIKYLPKPKHPYIYDKWVILREQVRARKEKYLDGVERTGTVTGGMRFADVKAYSTISRWRENDNEFLEREYKAITEKTSEVIDIAESKLFLAIQAGQAWAVRYALDRLSKKYKPKAEIDDGRPKKVEAIEIIVHERRTEQIEDGSDTCVQEEPGHTHPASC